MGNVIQESDLTGRKFSFKIAGDEPTVDEQQRIDAIIRQNDTEFAKEYESEYGVSATPGEGSGILNTLGEFGKGTGRGAVNLLESAGLGAASMLSEEQELPVREFIRGLGYSARSKLQPDLGVEDMAVGEEAGKFGEALGSFAPLAATAVIPGVGMPIAGSLAVGAGAGEASERARAAGASQEDRNKAALLGAGVGLTELIPLSRLGPLRKVLEDTGQLARLKRLAMTGGLEGLQEAVANTAQNLIEQGYNPESGTFDGTGEAAGYGAAVGALVQGITDLVIPGRFSKKTPPPPPPEQKTQEGVSKEPEPKESKPVEEQPIVAEPDEILNLPVVPDAEPVEATVTDAEIEALFKEEEIDVPSIIPEERRIGRSDEDRGFGVDGDSGDRSGVEGTIVPESPVDDTVGGSLPNIDVTSISAGKQRNPLDLADAEIEALFKEEPKAEKTELPQSDTRIPLNLQNVKETDIDKIESRYAVEQRNAAVARFQDFRDRNPDMAIYHDEFVLDKQMDEDIVTGKDLFTINSLFRKQERGDELTVEEQAAADYFERFERPEHAIEEIATRSEIDVSDVVPGAKSVELLPEADQDRMSIATTAAAFMEPFNKDNAALAGKWIDSNMSTQTKEAHRKEKEAAAERVKVGRRQKYKVNLADVKPRPKGKGAKAQIAQAEWDDAFADSHFATGKPKPTMSERVAEGARDIEADSNKAFNDQLDAAAAAEAKPLTVEPLPEELTKPLIDVGPDVRQIDRLTDDEREAILSEDADRSDDERALQIMKDAEIEANIVGSLYSFNFDTKHKALFTKFLVDQNKPLDPVTMTMLEDNNLSDALREYAKTASPATKMWARTLAKYAGNTEVRFEDKDTQVVGFFRPRENAIVFNSNVPTTGHSLLHEVAHAATAEYIANNPQAAPVQTLRKIYNDTQEAFPNAYNFDEFVAEAISNKDMRDMLSEFIDPNRYGTAYQRFVEAIRRIFQRIRFELGGKPPEQRTMMDMIDPLLHKILAPAPGFRDAAPLYQIAHSPRAVRELFRDIPNTTETFNEDTYKKFEDLSKKTWKDVGVQGVQGTLGGWLLKGTPLHFVVRMAERYAPSAPKINDLINKAGGEQQVANDKVNQVNDKAAKWFNKANQEARDALNKLNNVSTAYQVDPAIDPEQARERYSEELFDSIYTPLRADYVRLQRTNPEAIEIHHQIRNMFKGLLEDLINAVNVRLEASGVPTEVRDTIRDSFYNSILTRGQIDPYIPLQREPGDYWLSLNAIDPLTGRLERYSDSFQGADARDRAAESIVADAKENLRNAPEGSFAAQTIANLQQRGMSEDEALNSILEVDRSEQITIDKFMRQAPASSFVNDIMSKIAADPNVNDDTMQELGQVILNALPQTSYLQSFRQRKGGDLIKARMGYNEDSLKTVANRSRSLSRQTVQMKYKGEMQKILTKVEEEINNSEEGSREWKANLTRNLVNVVNDGPIPVRNKLSRTLTGIGFNMTLGANISGGIVNLGQIPLVTFPYLTGKYGMGVTSRSIKGAVALMKNSGLTRKIQSYGTDLDGTDMETQIGSGYSISNHDTTNLSPQTQRILNKLGMTPQELQVFIDVGTDLGQFKRSLDHEILEVDRQSGFWATVNKYTGFFQHHSERVNRETAYFAAYNGALSQLSAEQRSNPDALMRAAQQAVYDTETTNGGIAAGAAPELTRGNKLGGLGAVVFMYKRYGVSMVGMLTEMAIKVSKGSPAERRMALFQLAGIYGMAGIMSGVQGLPLFGAITTAIDTAMALMGLDPGGEDDDAKTMTRAYVGDGPYKGAINYFFGVNVASRIGLNELLFRDALMDRDWPVLFQLLEQLGGPIVGTYLNVERGGKQIFQGVSEGDATLFWRGIETMSPAALKNMQKGVRYGLEGGVYNLDGESIVQDLSPAHLAGQFVGFSPTTYAVAMENNRLIKRKDKARDRRKQQAYRMFARAYFDGDADGIKRAAKRIVEFNKRYPESPILMDNLKKSLRMRMKRKSTAYNGINVNPKFRSRLIAEADRFGDPVFNF